MNLRIVVWSVLIVVPGMALPAPPDDLAAPLRTIREGAFLWQRNFPGAAEAVESANEKKTPARSAGEGNPSPLTRERRASTMAGVIIPVTERAMSFTAAVRQNDTHGQEGRDLSPVGGGGDAGGRT